MIKCLYFDLSIIPNEYILIFVRLCYHHCIIFLFRFKYLIRHDQCSFVIFINFCCWLNIFVSWYITSRIISIAVDSILHECQSQHDSCRYNVVVSGAMTGIKMFRKNRFLCLHGWFKPAKLEYLVRSSGKLVVWTEETVKQVLHFWQKCQLDRKCCKLDGGSIGAFLWN